MRIRKIITSTAAMFLLFGSGKELVVRAEESNNFEETQCIEASNETGDQEVSLGNGTVKDDNGIEIYAFDGYTATVSSGSVTAEETAAIVAAWGTGSTANYNATGDLVGEDWHGLDVQAVESSTANVNVQGNVSALTDYDAVTISTKSGAASNVTINGSVRSEEGAGVNTKAIGSDAEASLSITGNITGTTPEWGDWTNGNAITVAAYDGASNTATVNGDLLTNSNDNSGIVTATVISIGSGSAATLTVIGNINEDSSSICGAGAGTMDGGSAELNVIGNIVGEMYGLDVEVASGSTAVTVDGDVSGSVGGMYVSTRGYSDMALMSTDESAVIDSGKIDVFVTGTLSSGNGVGVTMEDGTDVNNVNLTIWQITPTEDGIVAASPEYLFDDDDGIIYHENEEMEKKIKYIIKVEQPESGTVSVTDQNGEALEQSHEVDVANENQKVLLKVDLPEGKKLLAAYNGEGEKEPLLIDDDGNYYIQVPRGGGVYLSVEVGDVGEKYNVKFVNDDGTELQSDELEYGATPAYTGETPVKAETDDYKYVFVGWNPEISPVTGDIVYKATFKEQAKHHDSDDDDDDKRDTTYIDPSAYLAWLNANSNTNSATAKTAKVKVANTADDGNVGKWGGTFAGSVICGIIALYVLSKEEGK